MQPQLTSSIRQLFGRTVVYSLGGLLMRGIGFLLLPLYTRYLTRSDYGILAVTGIVNQILTVVYPLGLQNAVMRFYFSASNEDERLRNSGTMWLAMLSFSLILTLLLDTFGKNLFPVFFKSVPFNPFIRMAIWTAFFNATTLLPLVFFRVQERPGAYVITVILTQLQTYMIIVSFVVFQRQGAFSYLQGHFLSMAILTIPYAYLTMRNIRVSLDWSVLRTALAFGLPLVPHALATWVLEFSDRFILEKFVSLDDLGLYSIGYLFGSVMILIGVSVNNAWVPYFYRAMENEGEAADENLARLITYYVLALGLLAMVQALFIKELIEIFTAPAFHDAYRVAVWVIGGQLLSGLYFIPANFLMFYKKTSFLAVVTVTSGLLNVGLNWWLVPLHGIIAAAWTTFLGYGLMFGLTWYMSQRVHRFR